MLKAADQVHAIEDRLRDSEASVRIAAAAALSDVNGTDSAERLLAALVKERAHLRERIDGLVDPDQLARGLELGDPRAHVPGTRA